MLIIWSVPIFLIKFIKVTLMFGMCQNVEIIHQHHHHFYEIVLPPNSKNTSSLSKTFSQPSNHAQIGPNSPDKNDALHESHTSRFFHSKRSYLGKNPKGIEVVSCKNPEYFQYQKITISKNQVQLINQTFTQPFSPYRQHQQYHSYAQTPFNNNYIKVSKIEQQPQMQYGYNESEQKLIKGMSHSMDKSIPSIEINYESKESSVKTKQNYFNCHKLKKSRMGFNKTNIYDTKKKTRELFNNNEINITLSIPIDINKNKGFKQNSQIMIKKVNDKDSIITKKQSKFLNAFKTQNMFDDAKSIVSRQSLDNSQINIEESIIINRSMDYFCHITPETQLPCCKIYLAVDYKINWIVSIRLFEFKDEQISLKQSFLYNRLGLTHEKKGEDIQFPILNLYKIMIEGVGLHKNIYFVLEPYEYLLNQYLTIKKGYFRTVSSSFNYLVNDLQEQLLAGLFQLEKERIILIEPLQMRDIVVVNGKYKFHSMNKFCLIPQNQVISLQAIIKNVQNLKRQVIQAVNHL